jgi:hypothetical protein
MSIARMVFPSLAWLVFIGSPTSVSALPTVCFPPFHKECDKHGDCRCTVGHGTANSSGTAKSSGGTKTGGVKHPPVGGTNY